MKRFDVLNTVTGQASRLSRFALKRTLRRCKRQARKVMKRTKANHVLYGVIYGAHSRAASYHILAATPYTESAYMAAFRCSENEMKPLAVHRT